MVFLEKNYNWGAGAQYTVPAQVVGGVLEDIEERDGKVTKESFLEASRPTEAATHELFEWNDAKAAEKYRLVQSGRIINNLVVTVRTEEHLEEPITTKALVNIEPESHKKASYQRIEVAMSSSSTREIVLKHAMDELNEFKAKYSDLKELEKVFTAIDEVEQ